MSTTTYAINMTDSETPSAWMSLPCLVDGSLKAGAQDSGRCLFTVSTTDATALEAALDADDDVLSYKEVEVFCYEHDDCLADADLAAACAASKA